MLKKAGLLLTAAVFVLTNITSEALARKYTIKIRGWIGGSYDNLKTGEFSHCVVSAKYKRGDRLLFSVNSKYRFSVGIADDRWNLKKGSRYEVSLQVDRHTPLKRTAVAVSAIQLAIPVDDRVTFYNWVKRGRTLRIRANGLARNYSLRGTSAALNATLRCTRKKLREAKFDQPRPGDSPFAVDEPKAVDQPRSVDEPKVADLPPKNPVSKSSAASKQQALIYSINLLSGAGISKYKFLKTNPLESSGYQSAWSYSKGVLGALAVFKRSKKDFMDTQTAKILGDDARNCKGKFASGFRQSQSDANWSGRRLFTVCSNSGNKGNFTIHYSIGRQPSGVAVVVATIVTAKGMASGEDAESANIDQAIFESPGFRAIGK